MFKSTLLSIASVAVCVLSFSASASAVATRTSACNQAVNPHSFACSQSAFTGGVFKLLPMTPRVVLGPWKLLTYSPVNDTPGPEFSFLTNPQNPHIPEGVVNRRDNSFVGSMEWDPGQVRVLNWGQRGAMILQSPNGVKFRDSQTVEVHMFGGGQEQTFQCRLFLREGSEHLLCRWFTTTRQGYTVRGYMGFLRGR